MSTLLYGLLAQHERLTHREHQLAGVERLVEREYFGLFDEVGAGKTKQVVDAAQVLFGQRVLDTVLVVTPGFARSTWSEEDPLLGEVAKHAWHICPNVIHEYHKRYTDIEWDHQALNWVITNYEFIRRSDRLEHLMRQLRGRHMWLVLDESWAVKGNSLQTRACMKLRYKRADRVTLLNGTPLADGDPEDLFYQMMILDRGLLGVTTKAHFRARYCVMGKEDPTKPWKNKQVIGHKNLDELNARIAPHVLSRRTRDCFDLPDMLDPILLEARLSEPTWKMYREMRRDMVAWLGTQASISTAAITKGLRLAQLCSGYLGGLEEQMPDARQEPTTTPMPAWLRSIHEVTPAPAAPAAPGLLHTREVSREKLDAFMHWLGTFSPMPNKLLVWCRFRLELQRAAVEMQKLYPTVETLQGRQSPEERLRAKKLLAPDGDPNERGAVVGNQKAGGASLNFSAANIAVYMSQGPRLIERTQSIGRIERPGQRNPMRIVDIVAVGPKGQKTIDHQILKSLRSKDDMAQWTVTQWRQALMDE